ncbi:hypothetical protein B0H34DRAFT_528672 [Crassisporium funariophilum]|nr:hypothetical protein B0H34DRAFT_528672 [Crassisporium funariophilum]
MSNQVSPMLLTHICSGWRHIAHSTPRLWCTIHIAIPYYHPPTGSADRTLTTDEIMWKRCLAMQALTNILSSTMVSRLMINLRGLKVNSRYDTGPSAVPGVSRLVFKGIELSAGTTHVRRRERVPSFRTSWILDMN